MGSGGGTAEATLVEEALRVLNTADPFEKARLGDEIATKWLKGDIEVAYDASKEIQVPDRPARGANVKLVSPSEMPKLGKAGSLQSRKALVHSLVHTESWAIDLSWTGTYVSVVEELIETYSDVNLEHVHKEMLPPIDDIIARFGKQEAMPRDFFTDFVKVAQDEGRHFTLLAERLKELGSFYGAFPAHDGLWDSAAATSNDLLARLAIEHCVHEARGLDVVPTTISRFRKGGDEKTAELLETVIYPEEITHCAAGVKWFKFLTLRKGSKEDDDSGDHTFKGDEADERADAEVIPKFHEIVRAFFRGPLKPPFNEVARKAAGFGPQWYQPLAVKDKFISHSF
ncbi:hypothetical protein SASPL_149272 [Salvia splendens]|uniref:Uncharacterized protein n=1 Tax=Salvia splendens TaxID=180675 RepID=A0A8X8WCI0_SALSN|nr:hypothetical protein SASPL_149272 [Salvia splendens]